jgi:hypothetical protein
MIDPEILALFTREVLCEQIYRNKERWNTAHPCRALELREISPEEITTAADVLLSSEPKVLARIRVMDRSFAASALDFILRRKEERALRAAVDITAHYLIHVTFDEDAAATIAPGAYFIREDEVAWYPSTMANEEPSMRMRFVRSLDEATRYTDAALAIKKIRGLLPVKAYLLKMETKIANIERVT